MGLHLSHNTALEFLRRTPAKGILAGRASVTGRPPERILSIGELCEEELRGLERPLDVLVGSKGARKFNNNLRCHVGSKQLPEGSFARMSPQLVTSTPELCFLQMASELSFVELVELGYELCGTYRLDPGDTDGRGFHDDLPLTSVAELDSFLSKADGLKGRQNAQRALRHIAGNSASPMETILCMLLTLPYRLGGYGFTMPRLNFPVEVSSRNRGMASVSGYRCDLYWREERVDMEYDSDVHHASSYQRARDAARRNALSTEGVKVVTVTKKQVMHTGEFREVAVVLSKLLRKRLRYEWSDFFPRHAKLRGLLLPERRTLV